jgi:hypothetical protein
MIVNWRQPDVADYIKKLLLAFFITGIGGLILKKGGFAYQKSFTDCVGNVNRWNFNSNN